MNEEDKNEIWKFICDNHKNKEDLFKGFIEIIGSIEKTKLISTRIKVLDFEVEGDHDLKELEESMGRLIKKHEKPIAKRRDKFLMMNSKYTGYVG